MKGNIVTKRKAFHDSIRHQEIQRIFSEKRQFMQAKFTNAPLIHFQTLIAAVPSSFVVINQLISEDYCNQKQIMLFLRTNCNQFVQRCRQSRLSLKQWSEGMQMLIKMIISCQTPTQKAEIVHLSEGVFCGKYLELIQSNKMDKYEILMMILHYYTAALREPTYLSQVSGNLKLLVLQFMGLNWKSKSDSFSIFISFLNILLDKAIEHSNLSLAYELFISQSLVIVKLLNILQEIYEFQKIQHQQRLIISILRILINLTFAIRDQKLSKILMLASFREFMIQRLNSKQEIVAKQFFLQLACNIMIDQPKFTEFIRQNIDAYALSQISQTWVSLAEDIKCLCRPNDRY